MSKKIFISHGHNELLKHKLKDFVRDRLNMEPVILSEQADNGLTIVEKLEMYGKDCEFALILLTGDDETSSGKRRARQNVIHELGYFQGLLGRKHVLLIKEKGIELFSNISGLIYKEFISGSVESIFEDIRVAIEAGDLSKHAIKTSEPLRILIVGSHKYRELSSSSTAQLFHQTCRELGHQLANRGLHLVIGSYDPDTADIPVVDSYIEFGGSIITIAGISEMPVSWWEKKLGMSSKLKFAQVSGSWDIEGRSTQLEESDAVFIIGGAKGAINLSKRCYMGNHPFVATPQLGQAAKSIWDKRVRKRAMELDNHGRNQNKK